MSNYCKEDKMKRVMYGPWWGTDDWDEDEDWWDD